MARYIVNRVLSGVLTLFLFVTLLYFLVELVVPGDFVTSLGPLSADQSAAIRGELGLDRPLFMRYLDWLGGLVTLDMGQPYAALAQGGFGFDGPVPSVWDSVRTAAAPTLVVLSMGLAIAFALGGWLGRTAGYTDKGYLSGPLTFFGILCLTVFPPALAVGLERGVGNSFGWINLHAFGHLREDFWGGSFAGPGSTSGVQWKIFVVFMGTAISLWLIESLVWRFTRRRISRWVFLILMVLVPFLIWSQLGISAEVRDLLGVMSLLIVGVVILTSGEVLLVTKAAMDDVMLEDYVMVARAKGLSERDVRNRHAARTALLPVLSRFAVAIPYFLTGLVMLEAIFGATARPGGAAFTSLVQSFRAPPGLGTLLFDSVADQDTPLLVGALLVVGILTLLIRIGLDVAHAALDPRIRFSGGANGP
jgi:peptide/nickel transport system permease protein